MHTRVHGEVEHLPARVMNKIHARMNTQLRGLNRPHRLRQVRPQRSR
jgi:hypothetical protein